LINDKNKIIPKDEIIINDSNIIYESINTKGINILHPKLKKYFINNPNFKRLSKVIEKKFENFEKYEENEFTKKLTRKINSKEFLLMISNYLKYISNHIYKNDKKKFSNYINLLSKIKIVNVEKVILNFYYEDENITKENNNNDMFVEFYNKNDEYYLLLSLDIHSITKSLFYISKKINDLFDSDMDLILFLDECCVDYHKELFQLGINVELNQDLSTILNYLGKFNLKLFF
jgi:hypothetical protein